MEFTYISILLGPNVDPLNKDWRLVCVQCECDISEGIRSRHPEKTLGGDFVVMAEYVHRLGPKLAVLKPREVAQELNQWHAIRWAEMVLGYHVFERLDALSCVDGDGVQIDLQRHVGTSYGRLGPEDVAGLLVDFLACAQKRGLPTHRHTNALELGVPIVGVGPVFSAYNFLLGSDEGLAVDH